MWVLLPCAANTKKYSPKHMQQVPSKLSFFLGHLQVWLFFPTRQEEVAGNRHCSLFHTSNLDPSYVEVLHSQGSYLPSLPFQPKHSSCNTEVLVQSSAPAEQRESCVWPKLLLMQHVLANQSELGLSLLKMLGKTTSELFTQFPSRHFSVDK